MSGGHKNHAARRDGQYLRDRVADEPHYERGDQVHVHVFENAEIMPILPDKVFKSDQKRRNYKSDGCVYVSYGY